MPCDAESTLFHVRHLYCKEEMFLPWTMEFHFPDGVHSNKYRWFDIFLPLFLFLMMHSWLIKIKKWYLLCFGFSAWPVDGLILSLVTNCITQFFFVRCIRFNVCVEEEIRLLQQVFHGHSLTCSCNTDSLNSHDRYVVWYEKLSTLILPLANDV